jgi:P27 family predicted phage terminase small subunit
LPFLIGYASDEWYRVSGELHRLKLLTIVDVNVLAAYCQSYSAWRTAVEALAKMAERDPVTSGLLIRSTDGNPRRNPLAIAANRAAKDMLSYASEFGLTPAARAHLSSGLHVGGRAGSTDCWPDVQTPAPMKAAARRETRGRNCPETLQFRPT